MSDADWEAMSPAVEEDATSGNTTTSSGTGSQKPSSTNSGSKNTNPR